MAALINDLASDITAPVNFELMKGLLQAARKKLPFFNGTVQGKLNKNAGAYSVEWERIENLAVATTALAEPSGNSTFFNGRDAVKPTITRLSATMAKYGNAIVITEEIDLVQVNVRTVKLMETLGRNAGESMNTIAQTQILAGATNVRLANAVAGLTSIITAISVNDIKFVVNRLNVNSAMKFYPAGHGSTNIATTPVRETYMGICHPDVEEDIRLLTGFKDVIEYGGYTPTFPGEFGNVGGVRFCTTEIANITIGAATTSAAGFRGTTNTLNDVYDVLIYGKEAVGSVGLGEMHSKETMTMGDHIPTVKLIQHAPGSSGGADPFDEVGTLAWKAFLVMKVLNVSWIYRVRVLSADI